MNIITTDPRDDFEKAFPIPKHVIRCGNGYACTEYNAWGAYEFIHKWEGWRAALLAAPAVQTEQTKRLIGWRTTDYTEETSDPEMAKNWAAAVGVLPIFEGDINTRLQAEQLSGNTEQVSQPNTLREGLAAIRNLGPIDAEKIQAERDALNEPDVPDGWIPVSERMPEPKSERRVCVYTPTPHEDMRYRFVPASLFKTVCSSATHWYYMEPPAAPKQEAE